MQYIKDLPQTTQIALAAILVLLPLFVGLSVRRRRALAAKPADEATRKERRKRKNRQAAGADGTKPTRRRRRRLADEGARSMGETPDPAPTAVAEPAPTEIPEEVPFGAPIATNGDGDIVIPVSAPATVAAIAEEADETAIAPADEPEPLDDPYVMAQTPSTPTGHSVAQPGWPSPGELASGFDPDAFDPLPPEHDMHHAETTENPPIDLGGDAVGDAEVWLEDDLSLDGPAADGDVSPIGDTQNVAVNALENSWDDDDEFDPATGWSDDAPAPVSEVENDWDAEPAQTQPIAVHDLEAALDDDLDAWDDTDDSLPTADETTETVAHVDTIAWDVPDVEETAEPSPTVVVEAADAAGWDGDDDLTWDGDGWDDDDEPLAVPFPAPGTLPAHTTTAADLAVPFPPPGTVPDHAETAAALLAGPVDAGVEPAPPAETAAPVDTTPSGPAPVASHLLDVSSLMPAITGRIDNGHGAPVVIDLANLVSHGERVEVVIEQDESGNGVRLRFGAGTPAATAPAADVPADAAEPASTEDEPSAVATVADPAKHQADSVTVSEDAVPAVAEPAPDTPATVVAPDDTHDAFDIPFLTGGPRQSTDAGWQPVDEPVDESTHAATTEPVVVQPAHEPIAIGVGAEIAGPISDDPGAILAEIRARLAALDARRFFEDDTDH